MITLSLPDKWIRQALFQALNNQTVAGTQIPVFDQRVTADPEPDQYILIRAQANTSQELSFCGYEWTHRATLEAYTRTPARGNPGSRLAVDNIVDMILSQIQGLSLPGGAGQTIKRMNVSTPGDFYEIDNGYAVATKTVLLQFRIN